MNAGEQLLQNFQTYIVNPAAWLILTAGLLLFIYGLVEFMYKMSEGADHKEGVKHMIWGIAGMFIMVSVGGIIALLINTIGSDPRQPDTSRLQNIKAPF